MPPHRVPAPPTPRRPISVRLTAALLGLVDRALGRLLPGRGRHAAGQAPPRAVNPWALPWTTPTPPHVTERHRTLPGEESGFIRPYAYRPPRKRRLLLVAAGGVRLPAPPYPAAVPRGPS
jgi:hypothetical protein